MEKLDIIIKVLPVVHTSKRLWAVCHLQGWVCTQSTRARDARGDTGWQSGTGCGSAGILAGILLHRPPLEEFCCRRNQGTGRSCRWVPPGPVHQTRAAEEERLLWRVAWPGVCSCQLENRCLWSTKTETSPQTTLQSRETRISFVHIQRWEVEMFDCCIFLYMLTAGTMWVTV